MGKLFTRAAALVAGAALTATGLVTAELPVASAADGCQVTFTSYNTIRAGSTGAKAKAMECLLSQAGFATTVDGSFSKSDAKELASFRTSVGLSALKSGGRRAWSALLARGETPELKTGDTGADVQRAQLALRAAAFKIPTLGTVDAATVKAVKAAQKRRGLKVTGVVDAKLWSALQHGKITAATVKKAKKKKAHKSSGSRGAKALAFARKQLGERYRYGAAGPNAWDCSGLTMKAWNHAGKSLPHSSRGQFKRGKKVSKSHLRKGDLVFFYSGISHVGIYAGHGKIIHASRPGKPVGYIKMKYMPYKGARRP